MFGNFNYVEHIWQTEKGFEAKVSFNSDHFVYKAHFPEKPITPGVCLLEIAKELIETHYGKCLILEKASNIKYLQVIDPRVTPRVTYIVKCSSEADGKIAASVLITDGEKDFTKISMTCRAKENPFESLNVAIVIPTYNNVKTLGEVIDSVMQYTDRVIVVDDGSMDNTAEILAERRVTVVGYERNKGKGYALKRGIKKALEMGCDYAITIDSDGQHKASELPNFLEAITTHPHSLIVGNRLLKQENMPKKNTFANRFSNFWFTVQTLRNFPDTQSGYRAYPIRKMQNMRVLTNRYEAELEMLVRSAWRGIELRAIPIDVYYPPMEERVSHFRPTRDFLRISLLNTCLVFGAIFYGYPRMLAHKIVKK